MNSIFSHLHAFGGLPAGSLAPSGYRPRVADGELERVLGMSPAVVIEGPRACGKTWTALRVARSAAVFDESDDIRLAAALDAASLLVGDAPRLLDEWQLAPRIWNPMRHECDRRARPGQFILTGSATPPDDITRHSGAGRITRLRMRPMSLSESGESTGSVSLAALLDGDLQPGGRSELEFRDIVDVICRGGWPGWVHESPTTAQSRSRDYLGEIARVDIARSAGTLHDPTAVGRLIVSLARNEATCATFKTLAADVSGGSGVSVHPRTVKNYINTLSRLFVIEELPPWAPHLRSASQLRRTPKRYFADPCLAAAALRADSERLRRDLEYLGLLFESLAMRDLRVYSQVSDCRMSYYQDSTNLEVDAVIERGDGAWIAAEIKLGGEKLIQHGVNSLLRLRDRVDKDRTGEPAALLVITAAGYSFRHPDGVLIAPIATLRP